MEQNASILRGPSDRDESFVVLVTEHQTRLEAYIFSLLGDRGRAADVLQETNLVLWRKRDEYRREAPFLPWAFAVARFQALAHLRDRKRELSLVDAELAEALAEPSELLVERFDEMRTALQICLEELPDKARQMIDTRYFLAHSIASVAQQMSMKEGAVKVALLRARKRLAECVSKKLGMRWSP